MVPHAHLKAHEGNIATILLNELAERYSFPRPPIVVTHEGLSLSLILFHFLSVYISVRRWNSIGMCVITLHAACLQPVRTQQQLRRGESQPSLNVQLAQTCSYRRHRVFMSESLPP